MTENHGRWIVRNYRLHHGVYWLLVIVTLVQPRAPPVVAQVASLPPSPPGVYPFDSNIKVTPKMTIILLCLMSTFFLLVCAFVYLRQCVARRTSRSLTGGVTTGRRWLARGLDAEVIDSFPTFVYSEVKELKIGKGALECAVCLNEFEDDETLRLLSQCSHVFHADCIDTWLSSHVTCPVCRADLIPKPGEPLAFTVLSHDTDTESTHQHNQNPDRAVDDFVVNISDTIQNQTGPRGPISDGDIERFTLRLPEEVRSRLVRSSLSRTRSCLAFPRARSWRTGYRSSSGGTGRGTNFFYYERFGEERRSDRWEFMLTPPFISRDGSVR